MDIENKELTEYLDEVDGFVKLRPIIVIDGEDISGSQGRFGGDEPHIGDGNGNYDRSKYKGVLGDILDTFTHICTPTQCGQFRYDQRKKKHRMSEGSSRGSPSSRQPALSMERRRRGDSGHSTVPLRSHSYRKSESMLPPQHFFRPVSEDEDFMAKA
uniref:Uncharacterized protein n=1 Tax=Trieres chinensis TaxID=1514140 RepID=A0A7S1Z6V3_TRICV|mmetsp:Transcript_18702/g.37946  ORF Transcript_18702/g.37946 Transcript_18702/m.37946 type:complete len:157 (+) Transcript_18702:206-676(+)